MKKLLAVVLMLLFTTAAADFKSTFLIGEHNAAQYSTLSWLSNELDNNWRDRVIAKLRLNGDTHADIMARNHDPNFKAVDGVNRVAWRERLNKLRDKNLSPVMWLISDDSPNVYKQGLQNQIEYQNKVVDAVDDLVSHYVVCLECDEYYSAQEVSVLIQNLRNKGVNKPIGVHLTPGVKPEYYAEADVIYLQTGFNLNESQFRKSIEEALRLGKPVVVSEYHLNGTSSEAKRLGDIACSYEGVIGTGNGRGQTSCQTLKWGKKKKDWYQEYEKELIVTGIGVATLFAVLSYTKKPTVQLHASDDGYEIGLRTDSYKLRYSEERILATYDIRF